jgi:release factor glutamine methyltransferase
MTLGEWLARGEAQLGAGPHAERARRDAETLLQQATGKNRAWLMAHAEDQFAGCAAIGYATLLNRRAKGEPIQYITGEAEFYGLPFRVNRDVLIPRPETEHVVERVLELAAQIHAPRIVDVGTGSGAIGVVVARHLPQASITATDCLLPALEIARENAARSDVAARIRFLHGDLLAPVMGERFDIVVSNPPYVAENDRATLAVEVREFEPATALFAGGDGLDLYRRLIPQGWAALVGGGWLVLEIGYGQQAPVVALLEQSGYSEIGFTSDLQGLPRVAAARRPVLSS